MTVEAARHREVLNDVCFEPDRYDRGDWRERYNVRLHQSERSKLLLGLMNNGHTISDELCGRTGATHIVSCIWSIFQGKDMTSVQGLLVLAPTSPQDVLKGYTVDKDLLLRNGEILAGNWLHRMEFSCREFVIW